MGSREEEYLNEQADVQESSDESTGYDVQPKPRPSDFVPEGYYDYRKYTNEPDAKSEFSDLIHKDIVFANLKEQDKERISYRISTVQLCKDIFVVRRDMKFIGKDGQEHLAKDMLVADDHFIPLINFLKIRIMAEVNISRAIGDNRAAILDIMSINKISKSLSRKKDKMTGLGEQ